MATRNIRVNTFYDRRRRINCVRNIHESHSPIPHWLIIGSAVLDERRHEAAKGQVLPLVDSVTNEVTYSLRQQLGREFRVLELRAQPEDEEAWLLVREAETERRRAIDAASEGGENRDRAIRLLDRSDSLLVVAESRDSDWAEPHIQAGWNHLERALAKGEEARVYDSEDEPLLTAAGSIMLTRSDRPGNTFAPNYMWPVGYLAPSSTR